jgi:biopolymer transport protein ExbB
MEAQKPNTQQATRPAAAAPAKKAPVGKEPQKSNVRGIKNAIWVIVGCIAIAVLVFIFVFGNPANFEDAAKKMPKNLLGTIYSGGFIVPILQGLFLTVIALAVERFIAISSAMGKGNNTKFVARVKKLLGEGKIEEARKECAKQKGTVGAVVDAALIKYTEMHNSTELTKEQKLTTLQQTIEEATALEMPALQENLPILATLTTLGTLIGLLGTVIGMIKSFQALAQSGAPDSTELSKGISEALVNTAFGILTAAFAVISYNYYTNKIDKVTYAIDEVGFSIVQTFAATH